MGAVTLELNENYEIVCFIGLWLQQPFAALQGNQIRAGSSTNRPPSRYYVLVLRGKHVPQRSANSKVIHQQNEIINVMNTCSHTSIFRLLEIGPGGPLWWWWCLGGSAERVRPGVYQDTDCCLRCHTKVFGVIWGLILFTLFNSVNVVKAPVSTRLWGCNHTRQSVV